MIDVFVSTCVSLLPLSGHCRSWWGWLHQNRLEPSWLLGMIAAVICRSPLVLKQQALMLPGSGKDVNLTILSFFISPISGRKYKVLDLNSSLQRWSSVEQKSVQVYLFSLECE